jgi:hypothetical protein
VSLTLTGSSHYSEVFFDRSIAQTYDEEKPVEDATARAGRQAVEWKAWAQRFPHPSSKSFYRDFV